MFEFPSRTPFTQHSCSVFRLIIVQLVSSVGTCRISPALKWHVGGITNGGIFGGKFPEEGDAILDIVRNRWPSSRESDIIQSLRVKPGPSPITNLIYLGKRVKAWKPLFRICPCRYLSIIDGPALPPSSQLLQPQPPSSRPSK